MINGCCLFFRVTYFLYGRLWPFLRRLEMVVLHVNVADDVVVHNRVFAWTEVPRLLLRVVGTVLETLQLVVEVKDVVGLLIAQGSVLVLSKSFDRILLLELADSLLSLWIGESLRNRVVLHFLFLDVLRGDLLVRLSHALEVLLGALVCVNFCRPIIVAVSETVSFAGLCKSVIHFPSL